MPPPSALALVACEQRSARALATLALGPAARALLPSLCRVGSAVVTLRLRPVAGHAERAGQARGAVLLPGLLATRGVGLDAVAAAIL